jgi:hypothetical protein
MSPNRLALLNKTSRLRSLRAASTLAMLALVAASPASLAQTSCSDNLRL